MTVEVVVWHLDMPALARCGVCGDTWRRPKGRRGPAELADFEARHAHPPPALFDADAYATRPHLFDPDAE